MSALCLILCIRWQINPELTSDLHFLVIGEVQYLNQCFSFISTTALFSTYNINGELTNRKKGKKNMSILFENEWEVTYDNELLLNGDNLLYFGVGSSSFIKALVEDIANKLAITHQSLIKCIDAGSPIGITALVDEFRDHTEKCEIEPRKLIILKDIGSLSTPMLRNTLNFMKKVPEKGSSNSQLIVLAQWEPPATPTHYRNMIADMHTSNPNGIPSKKSMSDYKAFLQSAWEATNLLNGTQYNTDALLGRVGRIAIEFPFSPVSDDASCRSLGIDRWSISRQQDSCLSSSTGAPGRSPYQQHTGAVPLPKRGFSILFDRIDRRAGLGLVAAGAILAMLLLLLFCCCSKRRPKDSYQTTQQPSSTEVNTESSSTNDNAPVSAVLDSPTQSPPLDDLPRAELQRLAKACGIKANQSTARIIELLREMQQ